MDTRRTHLESHKYYHIYNRGINGARIFIEEKNYEYFLKKYDLFVFPYVETFAYCLLRNHFHLLIKIKSEEEIRSFLVDKYLNKKVEWLISNAFGSLFKSYAQAINKSYGRTGSLFEEPFHRIEITTNEYYQNLLIYIHQNPQRHGFVKDFRDYRHSSYYSFLGEVPTKLKRVEVLEWFKNREEFIDLHNKSLTFNEFNQIYLEHE